jgi:hypothetical protein
MFFAVNPAKSGWPEHLLATVVQWREQHQKNAWHVHLLVDASFDQSLSETLPWRRSVACSLYADMRLAGLNAVAPHLLRLPEAPKKQLPWLQQLLATCSGKPMLSLVISAIPADQLRIHLQPYLRARTADGLEWPVRWADTRVLPGLLAALTPEEREHLLSPIHLWLTLDREGAPVQWQGAGSASPEPAAFDCWALDEVGFSKLLAAAEADAVLSQIDERRPDLLTDGMPADIHRRVAWQLLLATRHHIDKAPDRLHFAMLGLMLAPGFADAPPMQAALARIAQGADYQTEIAGLPAEFWTHYQQGKSA